MNPGFGMNDCRKGKNIVSVVDRGGGMCQAAPQVQVSINVGSGWLHTIFCACGTIRSV